MFFFDPTTLPRLLEAQGFTVKSSRTFRDTGVGGLVGRTLRQVVQTIERHTTGGPLLEVFAQAIAVSDRSST